MKDSIIHMRVEDDLKEGARRKLDAEHTAPNLSEIIRLLLWAWVNGRIPEDALLE